MEAQDLSNQILNDIEKEKIIAFAEDTVMFEAVKKYILAVTYQHGVMEPGKPFQTNMNFALQVAWRAAEGTMPRDDKEIGQDLRALTKASQLVGSGFKEIKEMEEASKVEKLPEEETNKAE